MTDQVSTSAGDRLNGEVELRTLAGVDEAGLGPILGPLVVAGTTLIGPAGDDPWRLLRRLVSKRRTKTRLHVADSKLVHSGPGKLARLERTVLTFWGACRGELPATVAELLAAAGVDHEPIRLCPWYANLDAPLPRHGDREELQLWAHRLQRELRRRTVVLDRIVVRVVDVAEFNALIAATDNKSEAHFTAYAEVLGALLARPGAGSSRLVADRCGGRIRYADALRRHCRGADITVLSEDAVRSDYRVRTSGGSVAVTFAERAENRSFPTALASCVAKYFRELLVGAMNDWFCARAPGLRRTAGYYRDGRRFLADVAALIEAAKLPRERLIRSR